MLLPCRLSREDGRMVIYLRTFLLLDGLFITLLLSSTERNYPFELAVAAPTPC